MNARLTNRRCHCCGQRSVWRLILATQEIVYRVWYCATCDLAPDKEN